MRSEQLDASIIEKPTAKKGKKGQEVVEVVPPTSVKKRL